MDPLNDWGLFTENRYRIFRKSYQSEYLPSEETIMNHRNQIVKVLSGLKIVSAILFALGDQNAAIFLMF
jgi:hypothetical protein